MKTWDNGGKSIKLDYTEFIDKGLLSGDSRFNMETYTIKQSVKSLIDRALCGGTCL